MHAAVHDSEAAPYTYLQKVKRFTKGCKEPQNDPQSGSCQLLEIHE